MKSTVKKVLLVEDDADIQGLFRELFLLEGFQVASAVNGKDAIEQLEISQELPSLIILDDFMPVMDGSEFRRRQLENPKWQKIPVIFVSANPEPRFIESEKSRLLQKPVDLKHLLNTIKDLGV